MRLDLQNSTNRKKNAAFSRNVASWILAVVLLAAIVPRADAHAFLDHAAPKVGSVVTHSPPELKIWFTENLEPDFSAIRVCDARGREVDKKDSHLDAKDKSLLIVSLPKLSAGDYTVTWRVVSTDTHATQGDFKFTVKSSRVSKK